MANVYCTALQRMPWNLFVAERSKRLMTFDKSFGEVVAKYRNLIPSAAQCMSLLATAADMRHT
jgi:hypothetical protein